MYRYNVFLEPPIISNVKYQRYADIEQEKTRNRVTIADLLTENPHQHQVLIKKNSTYLKHICITPNDFAECPFDNCCNMPLKSIRRMASWTLPSNKS